MRDASLFSPRMLAALAGCAALAFALSLLLQLRGAGEEGSIVRPSTYSHSAIGHAGLYETLRRLDLPVARSRLDATAGLGHGGVLVLAEPDVGAMSIDDFIFRSAPTLLLVLPKRRGDQAADRSDWIGHAELLPPSTVRLTLRLVAGDGEIVRAETPASWTRNDLGRSPELGPSVQLVRSAKLEPIIAAGNDILLGMMRDGDRRIFVLADPDPIENHTISRGGNAAFIIALLGKLRRGDGRIVFDETIHGLRGAAASPFGLLFRFPFVLATAEVLLAVLLLLLATTARFGAAESPAPALGFGKSRLIGNGAALLDHGGHHAVVLRRYLQVTLRGMGRLLHAPADLDDQALAAWLDRIGAARGADGKPSEIMRRAGEPSDGKAREISRLFALARDMHRLNGEISNGPAARKSDR